MNVPALVFIDTSFYIALLNRKDAARPPPSPGRNTSSQAAHDS